MESYIDVEDRMVRSDVEQPRQQLNPTKLLHHSHRSSEAPRSGVVDQTGLHFALKKFNGFKYLFSRLEHSRVKRLLAKPGRSGTLLVAC